jgi:hypothetical protein
MPARTVLRIGLASIPVIFFLSCITSSKPANMDSPVTYFLLPAVAMCLFAAARAGTTPSSRFSRVVGAAALIVVELLVCAFISMAIWGGIA